jgi:hypothetical protein
MESIVLYGIAKVLESETNQTLVSERAGDALQYIRTAIVHSASLSGRRKRPRKILKFSLIEWCHFEASARCRGDKKSVLDLMRTLRRIRKGMPVKLKSRMSAVKFFDALSSECSQKGDARVWQSVTLTISSHA